MLSCFFHTDRLCSRIQNCPLTCPISGVKLQAPLEADRAESEYEAAPSFSGPRADMVCVSGAGLGPVVASRSTQLHIDASLAGMGDIDVYVDGPTRTPIHCVDNHDGTCSMYYVPRIAGIYWLRVMFDGKHVTGSPFQV